MALSYVLYTNQTSTGPYNITFPYISTAHVYVEKNGTPLTLTTDYTLSTSPTPRITLVTALAATDVLRIYRKTPGRSASPNNLPLVDFTDGSVLTATDLDKNTLQLLYLVQESDDTASGGMALTTDESGWDAESLPIRNISGPLAASDAATKQYVDNLALYGVNQASGQAWDFVGNGTAVYQLSNPDASAADPELFIVEVGGAIQHPTTNYTITTVGSARYLQLSDAVASPTKIRVRNFGVSRGTISGSTITVDGSTLSIDMANNRVGIGTTTPPTDLNVNSSTSITRVLLTNSTTGNATNNVGFGLVTSGLDNYVWNYGAGPMIFGTSSAERMRIDSAGNLSINATSVASGYKLDVNGSATIGASNNVTPNVSGDGQLRVEGSGYTGYVALDGTAMHIGNNSSSRAITFDIGSTEVARITTAGNVGIGRIDANAPLSVKNNVAANTTTSSNVANQVRLYDATNAIYGLGVSTGSLNISANQGTSAGEINFWTGGNDSTAPSNRLAIPANSGGIRFPSTAVLSTNANTLDDYRESSHVFPNASFVGATTAGSYNLTTDTMFYTRIGNRVMFDFVFTVGVVNTAGSGAATFVNAPFSASGTSSWFPCYWQGLSGFTAANVLAWWTGTTIYFYYAVNAAAPVTLPITSFVSNSQVRFCGQIRV